MDAVTVERIEAVQADIEAINRISSRSLSQAAQEELLKQGCSQACKLLKDWRGSGWWDRERFSGEPIRKFVPRQRHFNNFLGPELKAVLMRASRPGRPAPDGLVDEARMAVKAAKGTAHRHRDMTLQQLFDVADQSIGKLEDEVCELAAQLRDRHATPEQRQKAYKILKGVGALTGTLLIAMAGVSPGDALNHLNQWDRAAIQVVALQNLAERANPPGWRVEPVPPIPGRVIREKEGRSGRAGTATPTQVDKDTSHRPAPGSVMPPPVVHTRAPRPPRADKQPPTPPQRPGRSDRGEGR
jgi:hypothetical protein